MLDPTAPVAVAGVLAFADLDDPALVWAVPATPRLARQPGGAAASLLVYRRRGERGPMGGQLTVTVDLRLSTVETRAVAAAAGRSSVRSPAWIAGTAELTVARGLDATGAPSLLADNACLFSLSLDADQATAVAAAWDEGLPDATVTYRLEAEAAARDASTTTLGAASVAVTRTHAVRAPFVLSGPIRIPESERAATRTDITL